MNPTGPTGPTSPAPAGSPSGSPDAWRVRFDDRTGALHLLDPAGRPAGRVELAEGLPPGWTEAPPLQRVWRSVNDPLGSLARRTWVRGRGRLLDGARGTLLLPGGAVGTVDNGRGEGWRRRHRDGYVEVHGVRWEVQHRSRRRTWVLRDGVRVARMRRRGLRPRTWGTAEEGAAPRSRTRVRWEPAATAHDALPVTVARTALGPAGRPGWWSALLDGISI
ncbi:hypothetical protein ACOACO_10195 [Nocardioides sp. CPCC 205120]|uniref:hypothetical protein n=1 Tax=Nocardioides sp. CPCC 205120 TaxID=3406462 RepID=UPI003B5013D8